MGHIWKNGKHFEKWVTLRRKGHSLKRKKQQQQQKKYSRTSRKRPPNMISLGRLWEVVAYESLDHNGSKLFLIRI